jgi:hypothetical protein
LEAAIIISLMQVTQHPTVEKSPGDVTKLLDDRTIYEQNAHCRLKRKVDLLQTSILALNLAATLTLVTLIA